MERRPEYFTPPYAPYLQQYFAQKGTKHKGAPGTLKTPAFALATREVFAFPLSIRSTRGQSAEHNTPHKWHLNASRGLSLMSVCRRPRPVIQLQLQ